jgi:arginine utilization regulatory protein
MIRRYVEQILEIYNYIDGLIMVDGDGIVEFYKTYRPELQNLKEQDILGKHILDVYPTLTSETSSILRVLRTGEPVSNEFQTLKTYLGTSINAVNTTLPIKDGEKIIGAVDVSRYVDKPHERKGITIQMKKVAPQAKPNLYTIDDIISKSKEMDDIKKRIVMVSTTNSPVLIYGETGTGKELVAQAIHTAGNRSNKRFISQNCAAIPSNLLESILFGTCKGSYTGAEDRAGLFEMASGGTLFLDEINAMELNAQAKLLKAIEDNYITRVGGDKQIPVDVRIVSAMNQKPIECINQKKLREDLFYRLSVVQFHAPPLRKRDEDLEYLVHYFIDEYNRQMGKNISGIDEEVQWIMSSYNWPGNVRELKNVIEGAFNVASKSLITKSDLPEYLVASVENSISPDINGRFDLNKSDFNLKQVVEEFEKRIIIDALAKCDNTAAAARLLKLSKQSLSYKMEKYNLH